MTTNPHAPLITLFSLLTVWGPADDVECASTRMARAVEKYYGGLDAWTWPAILSDPPKEGPWPSEGMLLRQSLLVSKQWDGKMEQPDARVRRVLKEVGSDRVACVGWGVSNAKDVAKKAFVLGQGGSSDFLFSSSVPPHFGGMGFLQDVKEEQRERWEQSLYLKVGEGEHLLEKLLVPLFAPILPLIHESQMSQALPEPESVRVGPALGSRRL